MNMIDKPDDINTETVIHGDRVGIRIKTRDMDRDITLSLAGWLIQELTQRMVEAANLEKELATNKAAQLQQDHGNEKTLRFARIGENYSLFKWNRADTGDYISRAANGLQVRVFNTGKRQWFGQVGTAVLNENKPVTTKVEAIELVENVLIGK